jgi:phosphoribosylanthranilate isomerase
VKHREEVRVKICGITRAADAIAAVEAGADAVGLMFYERSRRWVSLDRAREVAGGVAGRDCAGGGVCGCGRGHDPKGDRGLRLSILQFHGDESPEFCERFAPLKSGRRFGW